MDTPHPRTPPRSPHAPHVLPPAAYDDFQFFSPSIHPALPPPPPLPPSNELFSASETTDFFGFLENFDWDFNVDPITQLPPDVPTDLYQTPLQETAPPGLDQLAPSSTLFNPLSDAHQHQAQLQDRQPQTQQQSSPQPLYTQPLDTKPRIRSPSRSPPSSASPASRGTPSASTSASASAAAAAAARATKPLLSTPQKRLNHIMSEQKRRNAIRDGYLQLTTLLAPAGAPLGSGMPTRGRPKGSGARGRGTKGKSGILFRAREYIYWLEQGRDALLEEVTRLEAAAGIVR